MSKATTPPASSLRTRAHSIRDHETRPLSRRLEPATHSDGASHAIWQPPAEASGRSTVVSQAVERVVPEWERALLDVVSRPIGAHETHRAGNDRKEAEIRAYLERLPVSEAIQLHRRLSDSTAGDVLASAFGRFVIERRLRLLAFLRDARRRAAITSAPSFGGAECPTFVGRAVGPIGRSR